MALDDFKLKLFWGLDTDTFSSSGSETFQLDLASDQVLMNFFPSKCDPVNDCEHTGLTPKNAEYQNQAYTYLPAKTFLSWKEILPGDVQSHEQYLFLRKFDVRDVRDQSQQGDSDQSSPVCSAWPPVRLFGTMCTIRLN